MPYKDPEKRRESQRRYKAKKRAERFGPNAPDQRGRHSNHARGDRHGRWNSERLISSQGYVLVRVPKDDPRAFGNGYRYEHDVVAEQVLGRPLKEDEVVHHKNGIRSDNRPENLGIVTRSEHTRIHYPYRERDERGRFKEWSPEYQVNKLGEVQAKRLGLKDKKGGDPNEWPEHLRVREFPL